MAIISKQACLLSAVIYLNVLLLVAFLYSVEGGELFDRVVNAGHLSETITKLLFFQMVCGIKVKSSIVYDKIIVKNFEMLITHIV